MDYQFTNSKFVLNQSNRIAPSIDLIIQEANLVITRTVNQGFEEKVTAQTFCSHPRLAAAARLRGAVALELVAGRVWALPKPQGPVAAAAVLARVHARRIRDHDHTHRARTFYSICWLVINIKEGQNCQLLAKAQMKMMNDEPRPNLAKERNRRSVNHSTCRGH